MEYSVVTRFLHCHLGVDGDSITQGSQWSAVVSRILGVASHHNVGVGSAVWYKRNAGDRRRLRHHGISPDPDFAGISDGWLPTDDPVELQKTRQQLRRGACTEIYRGGPSASIRRAGHLHVRY